jgi:hypothetical protein
MTDDAVDALVSKRRCVFHQHVRDLKIRSTIDAATGGRNLN